ncbi:hypothetical protein GCM10009827_053620 [Dactylosporangium maewongense]|uniref:Uncharacterized protein n=1 Tax=Dactylosporangium maewongense TaxID=634393 RepID=A0ABP4LQP9_9ACTN
MRTATLAKSDQIWPAPTDSAALPFRRAAAAAPVTDYRIAGNRRTGAPATELWGDKPRLVAPHSCPRPRFADLPVTAIR